MHILLKVNERGHIPYGKRRPFILTNETCLQAFIWIIPGNMTGLVTDLRTASKCHENNRHSPPECRSWMLWKSFTNIYTANEEAVFKSILFVSLDNSSTLLFILGNSGLKIGNCCWLVLLSVFPVFPARLFIKFNGQEVVKLLRR